MVTWMERKTIVPLMWFLCQTNLAGVANGNDISSEKIEAVDQCPGWIVLVDHMLRVRWVEGHADTLRWHTSL